ncbi:MAG: glycoside hydrolase family 95 protein [Oscillospiraceae bacterium]|nr:glycoside hydrolase family 95 protein [Oscillospiraceae bacterium]
MKMWYQKEAREWTQALPIGNGYMGAMCYGGAGGRFDLSENTCWSGGNQPLPLREGAAESMKKARELLLAGQYSEAEALMKNCTGVKGNYGTQVPMGKLTAAVEAEPLSVYRELDLETGLAMDLLELEGGKVRRESFLSSPDKVMAVRMTAEGRIPDVCLWLEGWSQPSRTQWDAENRRLQVYGRALENIHSDGLTGVSYEILLSYETDGQISWNRRGLIVTGASRLTVLLTAAADMFEKDPGEICRRRLESALKKGYEALRDAHTAEHAGWMNRCTFTMPDTRAELPTDERIRAFAENRGGDDGLIALFFQYGRYLLLNSSRPDSQLPAALQGVWNDDRACRMEWTDDMHLDINTQMNYYLAENTGLGDCAMPLLRWIKEVLVPNGKRMAQGLYGAEGWCAHTVSNAFGWAAPGWYMGWGFGVTCGGWVATHIWEHYLYTGDRVFLEEYYDVLYQSAQFLKDILMEDPETGELVISPSYSPENIFLWEGKPCRLSAGGTFDTTVARTIFRIVREAASVLEKEDGFTASLAETLEKLPPYRIGKHGQLMEWHRDFDEALPDHRHTSHLLSMHPFNAIDPAVSPELADAIRTTLNRRLGDNAEDIVYTNWAGALLITYYARLLDREKAGEFVRPMIAFLSRDNMMITHQGPTTSITGGIYELDGNTGFTAAVAEMLLQSYGGVLRILPAIPDSWKTGAFSGLRAYGGHVVSVSWNEQSVTGSVTAGTDGELLLRCFGAEQQVTVKAGEQVSFAFRRA